MGDNSQNVILTATFVTLGSTVGSSLAGKSSLDVGHVTIGAFFAMVGCSIIAEVDGFLGESLAVLIAGTAFVLYGLPALDSSYNAPKSQSKKTPTKVKK